MQYFTLLLDLEEDNHLISEYELYHKKVWPEILESIKNSGITKMEIHRFSNRLVMNIEATDDFSFERKSILDKDNSKVQEWEKLMWKYQQAIPGSKPGEKWVLAEKIFDFKL